MKFVISLFFFIIVPFVHCQTNSKTLKQEQQKIENKIQKTKSLLKKVKNNSEQSLNALKLINNQINSREELVRIYDNQVQMANLQLTEKNQTISQLKQRIVNLKKQYRAMLIYAYMHRSNFSGIMYILSSSNYNEAIKRNNYLKIVAELQKKQFAIVLQNQKKINGEIKNIITVKNEKKIVINEKKKETGLIETDKKTKEATFNKYKKEEEKLFVQLKSEENKKQELKQRISEAIKKEILVEQKKQADKIIEEKAKKDKLAKEKVKKLAEDKKITSSKEKTNGSSSVDKNIKNTENPVSTVYIEPQETIKMDKNFQFNKGKLPWPVSSGSITERYGRNPHPTLNGVVTNNNGIDITCSEGSSVRAVFEGEVTSVFNIPGAGKVIIIKHGNYRSVYSNINENYVKIGAKVSTKQNIGSLIKDGDFSVCHLEIHQVINGVTQSLNPSLWISK
jgi:septal ring factor EnvC (AmiA/AmiB activator)